MATTPRLWHFYVEKSASLLDIGQSEVFLDTSGVNLVSELPWSFVVDIEWQLDRSMNHVGSFICVAKHPCGITFRWWLNKLVSYDRGYLVNQEELALLNLLPMGIHQKLTSLMQRMMLIIADNEEAVQCVVDNDKNAQSILMEFMQEYYLIGK